MARKRAHSAWTSQRGKRFESRAGMGRALYPACPLPQEPSSLPKQAAGRPPPLPTTRGRPHRAPMATEKSARRVLVGLILVSIALVLVVASPFFEAFFL